METEAEMVSQMSQFYQKNRIIFYVNYDWHKRAKLDYLQYLSFQKMDVLQFLLFALFAY
jgi:hypothetical protein